MTNEDPSRAAYNHRGQLDYLERNQVENQVYALIAPILLKYGVDEHELCAKEIAIQTADKLENKIRRAVRGLDFITVKFMIGDKEIQVQPVEEAKHGSGDT